jgi:hypothetical protein
VRYSSPAAAPATLAGAIAMLSRMWCPCSPSCRSRSVAAQCPASSGVGAVTVVVTVQTRDGASAPLPTLATPESTHPQTGRGSGISAVGSPRSDAATCSASTCC